MMCNSSLLALATLATLSVGYLFESWPASLESKYSIFTLGLLLEIYCTGIEVPFFSMLSCRP